MECSIYIYGVLHIQMQCSIYKVTEKAFHKMQKHVGLASTKTNQTRWDSHDNTFSDYHPYIDLSNHTHHNSLFIVLEWLCVLVCCE